MRPPIRIARNGTTAPVMIVQPSSDWIHSRKSFHHCMPNTVNPVCAQKRKQSSASPIDQKSPMGRKRRWRCSIRFAVKRWPALVVARSM